MNIEPLTRWSGLPRIVDPRLPNHQWMLAISLVAGAVGFAYGLLARGDSILSALLLAAVVGISAFLAWVQGRELDPDHPISGLLAPVIVVPAILLLGQPNLLAGFWVVLLLRILNRSTGLQARPLDTFGVIALTGWLAWTTHPGFVLLAGLVLLGDSRLPEGHRYHGPLGLILILGGILYLLIAGEVLAGPLPLDWLIGVAVAAAFYLIAVASMEPIVSNCDFTEQQISTRRERAAQIAALLLALAMFAFQAEMGLIGQLPLWSAMVGVAAFQIAGKLSD